MNEKPNPVLQVSLSFHLDLPSFLSTFALFLRLRILLEPPHVNRRMSPCTHCTPNVPIWNSPIPSFPESDFTIATPACLRSHTHIFHTHHTPFPLSFFFFSSSYTPVLGWFLWPTASPPTPPPPPSRLLCSFRNFGRRSKILNQLQAAIAAGPPRSASVTPHVDPGECLCGESS